MTNALNMNVARTLWEEADQRPDEDVLIIAAEDRRVSYRELRDAAGSVAGDLMGRGIQRGDRVLVMLQPGVEFFATMFGISATGATAVIVDPGMGYSTMFRCLKTIKPKAIIAERVFHLLSYLHRTFEGGLYRISRGWCPGCRSWKGVMRENSSVEPGRCGVEQVAVLAFTSGSTGAPKPVVMDHGTLAAQIKAIREMNELEPGDVQMAFVPLAALMGPGLGCATVIPSVDSRRLEKLDPARTLEEMRRYKVTHCFASTFIWRRLSERLEREGEDGEVGLRRIFVGGAPAYPKLLEDLQRWTAARVYVAYGSTEAVPIATVAAEEFLARREGDPGAGCLVGTPVKNIEVAVVVEEDEVFRRAVYGEIGEVFVRGPLVAPGYVVPADMVGGESFASSEHRINFEEKMWHPTGDCAQLDEQDRLVLCGRMAHRVRCGSKTHYTLLVEPVFCSHESVKRVALVALGEAPRQRGVLVVECSRANSMSQSELKTELLAMSEEAGFELIDDIVFRRELPTDIRHRSKILRTELAGTLKKGRLITHDQSAKS